jgi:hypothetical protein
LKKWDENKKVAQNRGERTRFSYTNSNSISKITGGLSEVFTQVKNDVRELRVIIPLRSILPLVPPHE